jgi:hypothetical protein
MTPSPRLLLTIDYESWFALSRRHDVIAPEERRELDDEYSRRAIDPILDIFGDKKATFYLVGEMVGWYPELPEKIQNAGHEVGFHCHVHRRLNNVTEIEKDLTASADWIQKFNIRGYRAPMIHTVEGVYPLLKKHGLTYSSSLYAPTGTVINKDGIYEIPVSTLQLQKRQNNFRAPRYMTPDLLIMGEFPYGSSFTSGLFPRTVFRIIERALQSGKSPVIFLHPYEIVTPDNFTQRLRPDLLRNPLLYPFTFNKSNFLKDLLRHFPTSTMQSYIEELQ